MHVSAVPFSLPRLAFFVLYERCFPSCFKVAVVAVTSRRAEVSPEALRCFSHELTTLPTANPRSLRLQSLTNHVTMLVSRSNSEALLTSTAAAAPPSTATDTATDTADGPIPLRLPPQGLRAIIETEASVNSSRPSSGIEPVCSPLAELLASPQCFEAHLEQVARLAALRLAGALDNSSLETTTTSSNSCMEARTNSNEAVSNADSHVKTANAQKLSSEVKLALGPALQWAAAVVSQREPIISGSSAAASPAAQSAETGDGEGAERSVNDSARIGEERTTTAAAVSVTAPGVGTNDEGAPTPAPAAEGTSREAPEKGWNSVVGLNAAKAALVESLEWPTKHRHLLHHFLGPKG